MDKLPLHRVDVIIQILHKLPELAGILDPHLVALRMRADQFKKIIQFLGKQNLIDPFDIIADRPLAHPGDSRQLLA